MMSISENEAKKRAAKAKRTKTINLNKRQAELDELTKQKTKTARLRSELKAYKALIKDGWSPPGGK